MTNHSIRHHMKMGLTIICVVGLGGCTSNGLPLWCNPPDINETYMHRGASCGASQASFARFIADGEDVMAPDLFGNPPLHLAADDATLRALLAVGADPLQRNSERETVLHHVARNQSQFSPHSITLLVEKGVPLDGRNHEGNTALHIAAMRTKWRRNHMMRALIDAGADMNAQNDDGNTPLHLAVLNTSEKEVDMEDAIYAVGTLGLTLGYRYSQDGLGRGALNIISLLIEQGAATDIRNKDGQTPYEMAVATKKNPWVLDRLQDAR